VNARGDTVVARLRDIPHRVREAAGHGVCQGVAVALAVVQRQTSCDLRLMEPDFPEGEEREEFEELVDDLEMAASAISEGVSTKAVIGNVFADDYISRSSFQCISLIY